MNFETGKNFARLMPPKPTGDVDHDKRRLAEVTKALETGNIKAARKAAGDIRGRKEQKAADLRIDEYVAAQTTKEPQP